MGSHRKARGSPENNLCSVSPESRGPRGIHNIGASSGAVSDPPGWPHEAMHSEAGTWLGDPAVPGFQRDQLRSSDMPLTCGVHYSTTGREAGTAFDS